MLRRTASLQANLIVCVFCLVASNLRAQNFDVQDNYDLIRDINHRGEYVGVHTSSPNLNSGFLYLPEPAYGMQSGYNYPLDVEGVSARFLRWANGVGYGIQIGGSYIWNNGQVNYLADLDSMLTSDYGVSDINSSGQIALQRKSYVSPYLSEAPFIWNGSETVDLSVPTLDTCYSWGGVTRLINDSGFIYGRVSCRATSAFGPVSNYEVIWDSSGVVIDMFPTDITYAGDMNESLQLIYQNPPSIYDSGQFIALPFSPLAINDLGQVVGRYRFVDGEPLYPALWLPDTAYGLAAGLHNIWDLTAWTPDYFGGGTPLEINNRGEIIITRADNSRAWLVSPANGLYTVNTTYDEPDLILGDGFCLTDNDECSFRAAIAEANLHPGVDTIRFNITGEEGIPIIYLESLLPEITDPIVIMGGAQPGAQFIELDGSSLSESDATGIVIKAGGSSVSGLLLNYFNGDGLRIDGADSNLVDNMRIGIAEVDGQIEPRGNGGNGIHIVNSNDNTIGIPTLVEPLFSTANTIAHNDGAGIFVESGERNLITAWNKIFSNGGLGIDLAPQGVTLNDSLDADSGPNTLVNYPLLDSVAIDSAVWGRIVGAPLAEYVVNIFVNDECDSLLIGEGRYHVSTVSVTTDNAGFMEFRAYPLSVELTSDKFLTATATDANGNTSEFSACLPAPRAILVVNSSADGVDLNPGDGECNTGSLTGSGEIECTLRAAIMEANAQVGSNTVNFSIPGVGVPSIQVESELPEVTEPVVISGLTQPTVNKVEINGASLLSGNGLIISSGNSTISALIINQFPGDGLLLDGGVDNIIQRCIIGVSADSTNDKGNGAHGMRIRNSSSNTIGGGDGVDPRGNIIAYNAGAGVYIESGTSNYIRRNSLYRNGGLGIDIAPEGVNPNDSADTGGGVNEERNYPELTKLVAYPSINSLTVYGSLTVESGAYSLDFFAVDECDTSGYGEGDYFIGATAVLAETGVAVDFRVKFDHKLLPGQSVTATATQYYSGAGADSSTSEFSNCIRSPEICLVDATGDSIPNAEFEFFRVVNDPPVFTEQEVGVFTTDSLGCISMDSLVGTYSYRRGDSILVRRLQHSEPASKHQGLLGTKYSVWLDNAKFDTLGVMCFDTVQDVGTQEIVVGHTTIKYNAVISMEWDASLIYLEGTRDAFRSMANYMYDVTDGQVTFDTVLIFDDKEHWDEADFTIYASAEIWPHVDEVGGINRAAGDFADPIEMPRKWMGSPTPARRDSIYQEITPLITGPFEYRTRVHEFGHYAFEFFDEYKFVAGSRCAAHPLAISPYGFMDYQYPNGGPYSSEMSSDSAYLGVGAAGCQNNSQWVKNNSSCWKDFQWDWETWHGGIYSPIIRPSERTLPSGLDYLPGPNDNIDALDHDVGAKIVFHNAITPPSAGITLLRVYTSLFGDSLPGVDVYHIRTLQARTMNQGKTGSDGRLTALGVDNSDILFANGRTRTEGSLARGASASHEHWLYGEATVGASGISRRSNSYSSFGTDSIALELKVVEGDFPLIASIDYSGSAKAYSLAATNMFSAAPALEYQPTDNAPVSPTLVSTGSGYTADLTSVEISDGVFTVDALDSTGSPFFFQTFIASALANESDSAALVSVVSESGSGEFEFDASNTTLSLAGILTSPYPVIRTGLDARSLQAGDAHALGLVMSENLTGENKVTIRYSDDDISTGSLTFRDESSLQIFRWDFGAQQWSLVGGTVDTFFNEVSSTITETGVYAAFTTEQVNVSCCLLPGDASHDGKINIGDVTLMITRLFLGGAVPSCCEETDTNSDGKVNIGDITVLIAYMFLGGPVPQCGPAGMSCFSH